MDGRTWTTEWQYDSADRVTKENYSDGNFVDYYYNTGGN